MLQSATKSAGRDICARLARDGDAPGLVGMTVLPMTTSGPGEKPTVSLQQLDQFLDLHSREYSQALRSRITDRAQLRAGNDGPHEHKTLYRADGVGRSTGGPAVAAIG